MCDTCIKKSLVTYKFIDFNLINYSFKVNIKIGVSLFVYMTRQSSIIIVDLATVK